VKNQERAKITVNEQQVPKVKQTRKEGRVSLVRRLATIAVLLVLFILVAVWLNDYEKTPLVSTEGQSYERAVVTQITKDNVAEDGNRYGTQDVVVRLLTGSNAGTEMDATSPGGNLFGAPCTVGMNVIVIVNTAAGQSSATVYSQDRLFAIYAFVVIFAVAVVAIGGRKGIMAILALVFAGVCILYVMFPAMYRGASPVLMAVLVSVLTTVVTLGLLDGFTKKTAAAMIGTSLGVAVAGVAALLFGMAAGISGYNVSEIETLSSIALVSDLDIGQLLFAGIVISALGAVMDVGMSIASTVHELNAVNPSLTQRELFTSALHVGRDMMGTMVNTLIFAFVGGSLTTLVIDYAYDLSFLQLMNSFNIGIEIMQGLSGSLGVVLTVPITALVASWLTTRKRTSAVAESEKPMLEVSATKAETV
jgi:uncharacterized membrane protein